MYKQKHDTKKYKSEGIQDEMFEDLQQILYSITSTNIKY